MNTTIKYGNQIDRDYNDCHKCGAGRSGGDCNCNVEENTSINDKSWSLENNLFIRQIVFGKDKLKKNFT